MAGQRGFTVVELLIASAIMMAVIGATFALVGPAQGIFAAQPEETEMQQRLRVSLDMLTKDLMMAGAGMYSGPIAGSLGAYFAPVLPYRTGAVAANSGGDYFTDRITVVYVPPTSAQTRTADPIGSISPTVNLVNEPGCPAADPSCGFQIGMGALVMDTTGAWDVFTVSDVQGSTLQLQDRGAQISKTYEGGSFISHVATFTYWLKTDTATDTHQLMRYDGNQSDVPIADNVVGLAFEYFGVPGPGGGGGGLVKLSQAELTDGPWRPDWTSPGRYDADLRRIRRIGVTLRVQAPAVYRGPAGRLFALGGTSKGSERYLPDHEIKFDITPRNLSPGH